jgi:hypothetical protein
MEDVDGFYRKGRKGRKVTMDSSEEGDKPLSTACLCGEWFTIRTEIGDNPPQSVFIRVLFKE